MLGNEKMLLKHPRDQERKKWNCLDSSPKGWLHHIYLHGFLCSFILGDTWLASLLTNLGAPQCGWMDEGWGELGDNFMLWAEEERKSCHLPDEEHIEWFEGLHILLLSQHTWFGPAMVMCVQKPHNFTGAIFELSLVLLFHDAPDPFLLSQPSAFFLTPCTFPRLQFPYHFAHMFFILLIVFSPFKVQVYLVTQIILYALMPPSPISLAELCSVMHSSCTPNLLFVQWLRLAMTASDYCRLWDIGRRIS